MNRLTFEQEKQLIEFFKANSSLWNTKDKDYNNRSLRVNKLEIIAKHLQLTRKDVYEKYRNLRTTFFREHKRVIKSSPGDSSNSQSPEGRYVSRWRHYRNMLFLAKVNRSDQCSSGGSHSMVLNEDSTSQHQTNSQSTLQNGNDIELIDGSNLHYAAKAFSKSDDSINGRSGANSQQSQSMDSSTEMESSHSSQGHSSNNSGHLSSSNNHYQEDLIFISAQPDSVPLNGANGATATILANGAVSIINPNRLLPVSRSFITPSSSCSSSSPSIITTKLPVSTNSVIYTASNGNTGIGARVKNEITPSERPNTGQSTIYFKSPIIPGQSLQLTSGGSSNPATTFVLASTQSSSTQSLSHIQQSQPTIIAKTGTSQIAGAATLFPLHSTTIQQSPQPPLSQQQYHNHSTPIAARKSSLLLLTPSNFKDSSSSPSHQSSLSSVQFDSPPVNHSHQANSLSQNNSLNSSFIITNGTSGLTAAMLGNQSNTIPKSLSANTAAVNNIDNNGTAALSLNGTLLNSPMPTNAKILDYSEMREVIKNVVHETIVEDEEMAFCRSLAASLRTLERSKKEVAKMELQQVIVRYTNRTYTVSGGGGACSSNIANHYKSLPLSTLVVESASPVNGGSGVGGYNNNNNNNNNNTGDTKPMDINCACDDHDYVDVDDRHNNGAADNRVKLNNSNIASSTSSSSKQPISATNNVISGIKKKVQPAKCMIITTSGSNTSTITSTINNIHNNNNNNSDNNVNNTNNRRNNISSNNSNNGSMMDCSHNNANSDINNSSINNNNDKISNHSDKKHDSGTKIVNAGGDDNSSTNTSPGTAVSTNKQSSSTSVVVVID